MESVSVIAGQSPRYQWRRNTPRAVRTIEQAIAIARSHGVNIPEDVAFFCDEEGDLLDADTTARGPRVAKFEGETVRWSDLLNVAGKVPFVIRPDILESDEAIVAVIAHEMYELEALRPILIAGESRIETFVNLTCPGNPGNLHDQAWDEADGLVARMRGEEPK